MARPRRNQPMPTARPRRARTSPRKAGPVVPKGVSSRAVPVVGIGASAGGLEAFTQLLKHLDPVHESALTQILTRATSMPVLDVKNNLRVRPNHVYIIPPNAIMAI